MKYLSLFIAIIATLTAHAQNYTGSFAFRSKIYTVKSERQESGSFKIIIEETDENKSDFTIKPLKSETFDIAFKSKLSSILPTGAPAFNTTELTELTATAKSLFYSIVAESLKEGISDAPVSGKLTIARQVNLYKIGGENAVKKKVKRSGESDKGKDLGKIEINDIEIEFYEGYIETIKVNGTKDHEKFRFENQYGIGFSTRNNYGILSKTRLFDFKSNHYIKVGELLDYDYKVKLSTRDFSPGNQVLYSYGGQKVELHKDQTSKLFEAIVYSDFIGVDKDKPNGLIQTEVAKRINLYPIRIQTVKGMTWLSKGYGWLQYIRPAITISKVEENNRFLQPKANDIIIKSTSNEDSLVTGLHVTPLQVLNHQNLSLGIDANVLFLDNPDVKYNLYLNGGFRFGRTSIRDSLRSLNSDHKIQKTGLVDEYGISYLTFYPEAILHFLPEERFSVMISDRLQYFSSAFDEPKIKTFDKSLKSQEKPSKWINSFEIMTYVKTGENGKLFARWRLNSQLGNVEQHFHQIQLGYSFYILKKN